MASVPPEHDPAGDTADGLPPPREPATLASVRDPSNSVSDMPVVFPPGYEFIEWLGQGGMGLVARARDVNLDRVVALKLIRPELSDRQSVRGAFVREARAMARVRHRNVIEIYASGEIDNVPFFAMELMQGNSLGDWLDRQQAGLLPVDVTLGLLTQICAGVAAIHSAGAVHRDLKPANVLIGPDMRAAVTDLGLVQLDGQRSFSKGTIAGTPEYLSPELILHGFGHGGDDRPADVYALGIIAYEMLTGHLPFEGLTPEEVLELQMVAEPTPPSSSRPELPEIFDTVVLAALAKDPTDRPTATEFADSFARARASVARGANRSTEVFVVVDDDRAFRIWARGALEAAYPGCQVVLCPDAAAALDALKATKATAVVTDLDMPGMNGVELTATIREKSRRLPIVVATGVGGAGDWKLLRALGAQEILLKPMRPAALSEAVRRAMAPGAVGEDAGLSPGTLEAASA